METPLSATGMDHVMVTFELKRGNTSIGVHFSGEVQGRLDDIYLFDAVNSVWTKLLDQGDWSPPRGQGSMFFSLADNQIHNTKSEPDPNGFYFLYPRDSIWLSRKQTNRLIVENWAGEEVIVEFSPHNFHTHKGVGDTWYLTED